MTHLSRDKTAPKMGHPVLAAWSDVRHSAMGRRSGWKGFEGWGLVESLGILRFAQNDSKGKKSRSRSKCKCGSRSAEAKAKAEVDPLRECRGYSKNDETFSLRL
jgi:hypothetical protein